MANACRSRVESIQSPDISFPVEEELQEAQCSDHQTSKAAQGPKEGTNSPSCTELPACSRRLSRIPFMEHFLLARPGRSPCTLFPESSGPLRKRLCYHHPSLCQPPEVRELASGHVAIRWQSQDSNPRLYSSLPSKASCLLVITQGQVRC